MPVSVLLADDHPVVRAGLRAWFAETPIEIVGEATNGDEAFQLVQQTRPAVFVLEAILPKVDGLQCLARLREIDSPVNALVYTAYDNPTYAARASAMGAAGYVSKSSERDVLISAIETVAEGGSYWPTDMVRRFTGSMATPHLDSELTSPLTTRERDVLRQLAFGLNNKEIAQALGISYETVKEHVQHILRKLNVADRTQAAIWAVRRGLAS